MVNLELSMSPSNIAAGRIERTQARCDEKTTVAEGQWHSYCRRPLPRHGANIKPLESSSNRGEIVVMGR